MKTLAKLIRQHWSIESQLHWVLDVTFTEDASRIRKQHAPQTSAMLRRLAVSILSADTSIKDNIRGKRYRACLSTDSPGTHPPQFRREIRCDCRGPTAPWRFQGGTRSGASIPRDSEISKTITGVIIDLDPGVASRAALASDRR